MTKKKVKSIDDNFIMSPKYDFVFKYIFGNEKHKDLLIALLSDVLGVPEEEFEGIEIINSELIKDFKEDKKGILDVRVKTKIGKQIDVEIQILPTDYMAERTIFYWSKMYTSQIKPGDTYDKLKKCVTINIVDFKCTPLKKLYSSYHLTEDRTGYRLTDIIEVHFLEIPKLFDKDIERDENDPIVQWMEFLDAKSKGEMEMLAEKNKDIKKAYNLLQIISKDEKARMLYEARQAEISDQLTRIKSAEEKGIEKGATEKAIKVAEKMIIKGLSIDDIAEITELTVESLLEIKRNILH
ncbi:Rpn family recombination-promoting nuclease/putative transposase [Clostridium tagluense]|uniref:Rpn family recombination-promoting nuclease/putative transposase n=1 Tax=Clostridium tagluense TaxID=360422 RepID=UPI001C6EEB6A|nr:Rpn family recombination-promoting nuclease/putative transposase [Clostridium tagluense]MBW9158069.1 Rpn family recombination-promoting nuclease/putative transposase [Clostridium tagluense]WLC66493.1 Rpn family recombination-promoting nuclease/putative transposase [Clostridium tagluense]